MPEVLSIATRPQNFAAMIGQESVCEGVLQLADKAKCWLFVGESGSGKTSLARLCALSYQQPMKYFGTPRKLTLKHEADFAIHEINGADVTGVDAMRDLVQASKYVPDEPSLKRVYIVEEAHRISVAAQEILLRPMERMPKHLRILLATDQPDKLKKSLQRRCATVHMNELSDAAVERLVTMLKEESGFDGKVQPFIKYAIDANVTSAGFIADAFQSYITGTSLQKSFIDKNQAESIEVVRAMAQGNWPRCCEILRGIDPESVKGMRYQMLNYLRTMLIGGSDPARVAKAISILAPVVAYEDAVASTEILARTYTVSMLFQKG